MATTTCLTSRRCSCLMPLRMSHHIPHPAIHTAQIWVHKKAATYGGNGAGSHLGDGTTRWVYGGEGVRATAKGADNRDSLFVARWLLLLLSEVGKHTRNGRHPCLHVVSRVRCHPHCMARCRHLKHIGFLRVRYANGVRRGRKKKTVRANKAIEREKERERG